MFKVHHRLAFISWVSALVLWAMTDAGCSGSVCVPGEQKSCACAGGLSGVQSCAQDGSSLDSCNCSTGSSGSGGATATSGTGGNGSANPDDNSPFDTPADIGSGEVCGKKVGEYRGVASFSNGSHWDIHQCDDECQGNFPLPLSCTATSADGCGANLGLRTPSGLAYQCVEYARRFYVDHYGQKLGCVGNAVKYWTSMPAPFDVRMQNGVTKQLPQPDDLVIFSKGAADQVGHIAVVRKVTADQVFLIQQNVRHNAIDANYPLKLKLHPDGAVELTDAGGALAKYAVSGWIRSSSLDAFDCSKGGDCPDDFTCVNGKCQIGSGTQCGDGIISPPEQCDGNNLNGKSCAGLSFGGGSLACKVDCSFDTAGCTPTATCGDGNIDAGEQCDGGNLNGKSCTSLGMGFTGGSLSCNPGSCTFNTAGCTSVTCGNGNIDPGEQCDGGNLNGKSCTSLGMGFTGGSLSCTPGSCTLNTAGCACSPSVSNVSPQNATLNQSTSFTISGSCMPNTIAPFIANCANLVVMNQGPSQATFSCTPSFSTGLQLGLVKDAPGGNTLYSFNLNVGPCVPKVTGVSPMTATLSQSKTFTIIGSCLPSTITPFIPECVNIAVTSTSPTQATFQCTPSFSTGVKNGVVKDMPGGAVLKNFTVTVN